MKVDLVLKKEGVDHLDQGSKEVADHEDGGDGDHGGDSHHHADRGRQRHRAGAIQIVPTTLRWWLPSFYNSHFFSFTYNAKLQISPK